MSTENIDAYSVERSGFYGPSHSVNGKWIRTVLFDDSTTFGLYGQDLASAVGVSPKTIANRIGERYMRVINVKNIAHKGHGPQAGNQKRVIFTLSGVSRFLTMLDTPWAQKYVDEIHDVIVPNLMVYRVFHLEEGMAMKDLADTMFMANARMTDSGLYVVDSKIDLSLALG